MRFPSPTTTVKVRVGSVLIVETGTGYVLSNIKYDPAVLAPSGQTTDGSPIFRAIGTGNTTLTATASPRCLQEHPACGLPSALLSYRIVVVSS